MPSSASQLSIGSQRTRYNATLSPPGLLRSSELSMAVDQSEEGWALKRRA